MKTLLASAFIFATTLSAHAVEYSVVQTDKSALTFVSKQMGVPVNGRFPRFTAQVAFDSAKPDAAKVNISIDLASIDAGSKDANDEVVGKEWFNIRLFPAATFTSATVKSLGGGKYEVTGALSIKGKSKPVAATFAFKPEGNSAVFEGGFILKRIDFAIGEGPWADVSLVANEVQINFRIVALASASTSASASLRIPAPAKAATSDKSR